MYLELLRCVLPEVTLTVTALAILAIGAMSPRFSALCSLVAVLGFMAAVGAVLTLPPETILFQGMLVLTPLTALFKIICLVLGFFTILLARTDRSPRHHGEYLAMILFASVGLMLLVGTEELLMIFIGLELTGLSLYVLTGFDRTDLHSAEAGLKYFLFGSTASAFMLFGLSLIYGLCGTTSLAAIGQKLVAQPVQPLLAAGIVMTLTGLAFKIAAAPFHLWAPDTYQGAPIPSAAFIASASKVAAFVVLGKIVLVGFGPAHGSADWHAMTAGWTPLLAGLAALSIVIGNFLALAQSNVRRLLAYSAVAHSGYTLIGLVAGGSEGFTATLFYTTVYAFTLLGAFGVVAVVRRESSGDDLQDFAGLHLRSPLLAAAMVVFMLSLAGLPPLAGFFGKFYLFSTAMRSGANHGLLWLVALALFGSLLSLYYYLAVLRTIFVDKTSALLAPIQLGSLRKVSVAALAAVVLVLGLIPDTLLSRISVAIPAARTAAAVTFQSPTTAVRPAWSSTTR
jgi:NADH-quinone oxidoreductase subunit N